MINKKVKILFVTRYFNSHYAGAVLVENLINSLNPGIVAGVVTQAESYNDHDIIDGDIKIYKIFHFLNFINERLWYYGRKLSFEMELRKLCKIISNQRITHIVGVYPDLDFLELARRSSKITGVKFLPYLHDTIVEGLSHTVQNKMAKEVQKKIFIKNNKIFVMSEGMQRLYKRKYNIDTIPLVHSYPEDIIVKNYNKEVVSNSVFWGGSIYSINKETVKRIHSVCIHLGMILTVSAVNKMKNLLNMGFTNNNIKILPSLNREDYLKEIKIQAALLLGIDWPDESPVHKDELATIFPTKTVDYLISGRPIIVHCPENYFLGKFFKKHKCGFILNDRNTNSIEFQISQIFKDTNRLKQKVSNAFKASKQFHISSVKQVFESEL